MDDCAKLDSFKLYNVYKSVAGWRTGCFAELRLVCILRAQVFGPTGIGVLYGKETLRNDMQPWQGGHRRFEAGNLPGKKGVK